VSVLTSDTRDDVLSLLTKVAVLLDDLAGAGHAPAPTAFGEGILSTPVATTVDATISDVSDVPEDALRDWCSLPLAETGKIDALRAHVKCLSSE